VASIELTNVSVIFPIYDSSTRSLKNCIMPSSLGGRIGSSGGNDSVVEALSDVTLKFEHGDRVGLVGHNGAGKTTLLRVLAGLYEPCLGEAKIEGHIAPLFDIFLGMDPEATGYDNILLRALFLGMTRKEAITRMDDIAAFTELGEFLNLPMRTYSAGMRMRLAFAVSTSIKPDILLLDEGIGAGDASFLEKAEMRLKEFTSQAGIIVLASHSNGLIQKMCKTAILMNRGQVVAVGGVEEILQRYEKK
jgi:ABC-type polysaccharide/polyol phosphate transport system ATPase subunit